MEKLYATTRPGALGSLMDLYEQEVELLYEVIREKVPTEHWAVIVDAETKDEDCRSIQTICEHLVGAAEYYIELIKKAENADHVLERFPIKLETKVDFETRMGQALERHKSLLEGRWDMSDEEMDKCKVTTGWGDVLSPEGVMEHAVMHIMRHHRQILRFI